MLKSGAIEELKAMIVRVRDDEFILRRIIDDAPWIVECSILRTFLASAEFGGGERSSNHGDGRRRSLASCRLFIIHRDCLFD